MDLGLKDKVALVAGASSGIGFGIAHALSAEGARVVLCSRTAERAEGAAARIQDGTGNPVQGVAIDVLDEDAGTRFVAAAEAAFGTPTILITNAGGSPPGPASQYGVAEIRKALELNYLSSVRLTLAALPGMHSAGWGRLIHITSTTIFEPKTALFLSSTVRPAVVGFSKSLALELAEAGITSNVVAPGLIGTERLSELTDYLAEQAGRSPAEQENAMASSVPARRLGTPQELGDAVAFLCSERAAYITGIALRVDGGRVTYIH